MVKLFLLQKEVVMLIMVKKKKYLMIKKCKLMKIVLLREKKIQDMFKSSCPGTPVGHLKALVMRICQLKSRERLMKQKE